MAQLDDLLEKPIEKDDCLKRTDDEVTIGGEDPNKTQQQQQHPGPLTLSEAATLLWNSGKWPEAVLKLFLKIESDFGVETLEASLKEADKGLEREEAAAASSASASASAVEKESEGVCEHCQNVERIVAPDLDGVPCGLVRIRELDPTGSRGDRRCRMLVQGMRIQIVPQVLVQS